MNIERRNRTSLGTAWLDVLIGIWLMCTPFVLGFANNAAGLANNICSGVVIIVLTFASAVNGLFRALLILMGGWLYTSGFILGVSGPFQWNNLLLAMLTIVATVASEDPYPDNYLRRP